jgi:hypothetical protein
MAKTLASIEELVTALGGTAEVAEWAGVNQTAVCNWVARGFIPPGWHLRLLILVRKQRINVRPEIFGLTEDEFALLPERPSINPKKGAARLNTVLA